METSFTSLGGSALLGLGLVFGLKHATEVDHLVAVSTIVSEHRSVLRSALVGGLWGAGHTASLVIIGVLVLVFRVAIPLRVANWLEFGVALMIIVLGVLAVARVLRKRPDVHLHRHSHNGQSPISQVGFKPLLVGAMHGLAGSAALTLLVLTQIQSVLLGLLYLALFGIGSTLGMLLMSGLIGLPFVLSGRRLTSINYGLQTAAGCFSVAFGLWYVYATAFKFH